MKDLFSYDNTSLTWLKGVIGTLPPVFALTFDIDPWAHAAQVAFGVVIPSLMATSLYFDVKKKMRAAKKAEMEDMRDQLLKLKQDGTTAN